MPETPSGPDFSDLAIEDALQVMFMSIGEDAQRDTNDLVEVMDSIRRRVDSGDTGTPAPGPTAPGWGGGILGALPWVGAVIAAGLVGTTLGALGIIPTPFSPEPARADVSVGIASSAPAYVCPGGPQITTIAADSDVVAVARDEDGAYLGVRDPRDLGRTVWVTVDVIEVQPGQDALDVLPIEACAIVAVETVTPTPVPVETQAPPPPPVPAGDTTKPTIGAITMTTGNCSFVVTVPASDNVGVTGVTVVWTNASYPIANGSAPMTAQGGGVWGYTFAADPMAGYPGNYTVTATARDAAGNTASSASVTKNVQCLG